MTNRHIEVRPVTAAIGAEVQGVDLTQPLSAEVVEELHRAWLDHCVLFFRDQFLTPQHLKTLLGHFGDLHQTYWSKKGDDEADPYSHVLGGESGDGPIEGSFTWRPHIDNGSSKFPAKAIGLCAFDVPDVGGDTMFVNLYAAYEALSEPMKKLAEGLVGLFSGVRREQIDAMILAGPDAWNNFKMRFPAVEHPLVHTHPETGRKALFVDSLWTWSIKNLHPEESTSILDFLRRHCARPEFQCRFNWCNGSVALWDNRCTLHHRIRDPFVGSRLIQRASVDATEAPALVFAEAV